MIASDQQALNHTEQNQQSYLSVTEINPLQKQQQQNCFLDAANSNITAVFLLKEAAVSLLAGDQRASALCEQQAECSSRAASSHIDLAEFFKKETFFMTEATHLAERRKILLLMLFRR